MDYKLQIDELENSQWWMRETYDLELSPNNAVSFFRRNFSEPLIIPNEREHDYSDSDLLADLTVKSRFDNPQWSTSENILFVFDDPIAIEFALRVKEWKRDTRGVSSLTDMFMHPAYQRIMGMGERARSLILKELRQNSGHWFHALEHIAGKDHAAGTKTVAEATAAWLEWGYKNGYT